MPSFPGSSRASQRVACVTTDGIAATPNVDMQQSSRCPLQFQCAGGRQEAEQGVRAGQVVDSARRRRLLLLCVLWNSLGSCMRCADCKLQIARVLNGSSTA